MNGCPSRVALASFDAEGRQSALGPHVAGCPRCQALLAELDAARSDLFGGDAAGESRRAARRILNTVETRRTERRRRWTVWLPLSLTPVAAAAVLLLAGGSDTFRAGDRELPAARAQRSKGPLLLEVFCKRGDSVFLAEDGGRYLAGDRLRFAYTKDEPGHLVIFGVDDTGHIFPYYDGGSLTSMAASAGAHVMLPGAVELDDHRGFERIFALWTRAPLPASQVEAAVRQGLLQHGGDLRRVDKLQLDAEQVSLFLERP